MKDAGIVRNRAKIEGAVLSARAWLEVMEKGPGLLDAAVGLSRRQAEGQPLPRPPSRCRPRPRCRRRCRRSLPRAASNSCGPTIVYAFMQAVGMVNDHLVTCHRHDAVPCARRCARRSK